MCTVVAPFWSVQMTTNSAVNRNLTSVINNWNYSSKVYRLIKSYIFIFLHGQMSCQYDLK